MSDMSWNPWKPWNRFLSQPQPALTVTPMGSKVGSWKLRNLGRIKEARCRFWRVSWKEAQNQRNNDERSLSYRDKLQKIAILETQLVLSLWGRTWGRFGSVGHCKSSRWSLEPSSEHLHRSSTDMNTTKTSPSIGPFFPIKKRFFRIAKQKKEFQPSILAKTVSTTFQRLGNLCHWKCSSLERTCPLNAMP